MPENKTEADHRQINTWRKCLSTQISACQPLLSTIDTVDRVTGRRPYRLVLQVAAKDVQIDLGSSAETKLQYVTC